MGKLKLGKKYEIWFSRLSPDYDWTYILPSIEYKHNRWYSYKIMISWLKFSFLIEFIKTYEKDN